MKNKIKRIAVAALAVAVLGCSFPGTVSANSWKESKSGWRYEETDSGYVKDTWKKINNKWYFFDENGYMKTGWQKWKGHWYYLGTSSDGAMKTGWQKVKGKWYYMDASGIMKTGWQKIKGKWYYLKSTGAMAQNECIDWIYYVGNDGVWYATRDENGNGSIWAEDNSVDDSSLIDNVLALAQSKLGDNYVWGASGPDVFDCSGFVWYVFTSYGYDLGVRDSSQNLSRLGTEIDLSEAKPGSILFYGADVNSIHHIAIYLGDGKLIECGGGGPEHTADNPGTIDKGIGVRIMDMYDGLIMVRDWSSLAPQQ